MSARSHRRPLWHHYRDADDTTGQTRLICPTPHAPFPTKTSMPTASLFSPGLVALIFAAAILGCSTPDSDNVQVEPAEAESAAAVEPAASNREGSEDDSSAENAGADVPAE